MLPRRYVRVVFLLVLLVSIGVLVHGYATRGFVGHHERGHQVDLDDRYQDMTATVPPRDDVTVVTTSTRKSADSSIVAFAPDGSVLYYNETHDWYFDVDPVEGTATTVEYVAVQLVYGGDGCPTSTTRQGCSLVVVERVNLTTGELSRVHSRLFTPKDSGGWHDVDRLSGSELLVAGIVHDRVFVLNTTTGLIEWQWEAHSDFDRESGGFFASDWTHLNDVSKLEDGRVMVSLRNQDQVVFLSPDGRLLSNWTLGSDGRHDVLYEQHNPDFIPASHGGPAVLVSDSENNRIVEYRRTADGEWNRTWVWRDATVQWPRDSDRLPNGNTLVADSNGNRIFEIDRDGRIVWTVPVDTPYEVERLGIGDESAGGLSADRLGLPSRSPLEGDGAAVDGTSEGSPPGSIQWTIVRLSILPKLVLEAVLPPIVINGLLFVAPFWFSFVHLLSSLILFLGALVWAGLELHWSPYSVRNPIHRTD